MIFNNEEVKKKALKNLCSISLIYSTDVEIDDREYHERRIANELAGYVAAKTKFESILAPTGYKKILGTVYIFNEENLIDFVNRIFIPDKYI